MTTEIFLCVALALPPHKLAIVREFETFMRHRPGYEFYIAFEKPPEGREWQKMPYFYRSYRVFLRKSA